MLCIVTVEDDTDLLQRDSYKYFTMTPEKTLFVTVYIKPIFNLTKPRLDMADFIISKGRNKEKRQDEVYR